MEQRSLKLKGFSISKGDFETKYKVSLSELEWGILCSSVAAKWEDHIQEVRLMAFKHIKSTMGEIGYKATLAQTEVIFEKIDE